MLGEELAGPADEAGGGLVARAGEQHDVHERLVARERAGDAVLVLELRLDQLGHQVVGRVLGAVVDVLTEHLDALEDDSGRRHLGLAVLVDAQTLVDLVADGDLVLLGDAQQHPDREHRHDRAEVGDEVEAALGHEGVEGAVAELAHLGFDRQHGFRREHTRHQAAVDVVRRRVLHQDRTGRHLDAGQDHLERRALPGTEGVPVDERLLDVVEATQREERVLLVAVERCLVAHPLPDRVRVDVDLDVERVVVELVVARDRHGTSSFCSICFPTVRRERVSRYFPRAGRRPPWYDKGVRIGTEPWGDHARPTDATRDHRLRRARHRARLVWTEYAEPAFRELLDFTGRRWIRAGDRHPARVPRHAGRRSSRPVVTTTGRPSPRDTDWDEESKHKMSRPGGYDPVARLVDMDAEGIDVAVLYPTAMLTWIEEADIFGAACRARTTTGCTTTARPHRSPLPGRARAAPGSRRPRSSRCGARSSSSVRRR